MSPFTQKSAAQRLVLFVGGFDPRGAAYYHRLMRQQAQLQSAVVGAAYQIGPRERWPAGEQADLPHAAWRVSSAQGQSADYVFYDWSDVVRSHWPKSRWAVASQALKTYALVWKERRCLGPLHQQTPYTLWTLAYPLVYGLLFVLFAVLAAWGAVQLLPQSANTASLMWNVLAAVLTALAVLGLGWKLDGVLHVSWIMRIMNFAREAAESNGVPALQQRHAATAKVLAEELAAHPERELLVVGFSVGSAMAVDLLHSLQQQLTQEQWQRVRLVTLGNCIPLFSLMPQATQMRQHLLDLAQDANWFWVDISSPGDSVSFGMCDLMRLSLRESYLPKSQPLHNPQCMCTPRFHKLFRPDTYRWLRRNKMRMHFQYLMAEQLRGGYDYFAMLTHAGPVEDFVRKRLLR